MVTLFRRIACFGNYVRRRRAIVASLALVLALVLLGLPAFAEDPSDTPLYELVTAPIIDTYIDQYDGVKDVDRSAETKLRLRRANAGESNILLQFDLGGIPADAIIQSVELQMHVVYARPALSAANAPGVALYRVLKPWCADADWGRYCATDRWCLPGALGVDGTCAAAPDRGPEHVSAQISLDEGLYKLRVYAAGPDMLAQWVTAWVSGDTPNQGLLLTLTEPVKDVQHIDFAGSGYFGFPEASAPWLKVVYSLPEIPGDIGSYVWLDKNANGIRETAAGEPPVEGVTVKLFKSDGTLVTTKLSSDCGEIIFAGIKPADYYVCFEAPPDYVFSPMNVGADGSVDSDANPATGCTRVVTLGPGEQIFGMDAGLFAEGMVTYFPIMGNRATYWP